MQITERTGSSDDYRYGFQGQEKDDEIKGEENSLNYTFRMHDPRIGRFFAVDPLSHKYPYYSPYQFSGNRLIDMVELEGLEPAKTPQTGGCEDCNVEALKDGDYLSDVQDQEYTASFKNVTRETFDKFKTQMAFDPGKIVNNELASYRLVDRESISLHGKSGVKSAKAIVKEFDYNDNTNKIGKEEKDESFTEDLLPIFKKK